MSIISKKAKLEAAGQEKEEDEHGICEDAPLIDDEVAKSQARLFADRGLFSLHSAPLGSMNLGLRH